MPKTPNAKTVAEIMSRSPVCASPSDTISELAQMMDENGISGLPVTDTQNRVLGVVSKTDIIHRCLEGPIGGRTGVALWERLRSGDLPGAGLPEDELGHAEDFMTTDPVTAQAHEEIGVVARRLARDRVHRAVVVEDGNHVVGMVTSLDILALYPK